MQKQRFLNFGTGSAVLDEATGMPLALVNRSNPEQHYLLEPSVYWHTVSHYWGAGTVVTDIGSCSWDTPSEQWFADNTQSVMYDCAPAGLSLTVTRSGGDVLRERYQWRNVTDRTVTIDGLGVQTPFNDRYPSAQYCLTHCVNAHIFIAGTWSWALAKPMSGVGVNLGLIVREGSLAGYSIESRNTITGSNVRGHIVMQVTDHVHNPRAFGGQPQIRLRPGESYALAWDLGWYDTSEEFLTASNAPVEFSRLSAEVGEPIEIRSAISNDAPDARTSAGARIGGGLVVAMDEGLIVTPSDDGANVTAEHPGVYHLAIGGSRTEVLFHLPLDEMIRLRAAYVIDHQRSVGRPGSLADAFVPTDTRFDLPIDDGGWPDWTDGSERIAMPVLLQRARNAGILGEEVDEPLRAWSRFAQEHLIDRTGATRRGSSQDASTFGGRFYDVPWFAEFFNERFRNTGDERNLDMAVKLWNRTFELGGECFLAIGLSETLVATIRLLRASGRVGEAQTMCDHLIASADHFIGLGFELPDHEVAYEQSMIAPLLNLLIDAHRLTGSKKYLDAIRERLPWLLSFSGPQPDCRLYGVSIRHWDGYWFGINRMFGDVFPHYWSVLTATVLLRLPDELRSDELDRLANAIMHANMANYNADGSATCAFVFPSNVDGRPAHAPDPLANDQDWHLAIWLRLIEEEGYQAR
jgi:hypothetical protein